MVAVEGGCTELLQHVCEVAQDRYARLLKVRAKRRAKRRAKATYLPPS